MKNGEILKTILDEQAEKDAYQMEPNHLKNARLMIDFLRIQFSQNLDRQATIEEVLYLFATKDLANKYRNDPEFTEELRSFTLLTSGKRAETIAQMISHPKLFPDVEKEFALDMSTTALAKLQALFVAGLCADIAHNLTLARVKRGDAPEDPTWFSSQLADEYQILATKQQQILARLLPNFNTLEAKRVFSSYRM